MLSIAVISAVTKSKLGMEEFITSYNLQCIVKESLGKVFKAETEREAMEKCCFLAFA